MTNEQVTAARTVALRNKDVNFEVAATLITLSMGGNSEVVAFQADTPAGVLRQSLLEALQRLRAA